MIRDLGYDIYDTVIVDRVVCFFPFVMTFNSTIDNLPPRLQGCRKKKKKKEGRYHFTQISLSRPSYEYKIFQILFGKGNHIDHSPANSFTKASWSSSSRPTLKCS